MVNDQSKFEGGSSQLFISEIRLLKQKRHKIFTFTESVDLEPADKTVAHFFYKYFNLKLYRLFRDSVTNIKPDVIHFHNNIKSTFSFYLVLSSLNIPTIHTLHDVNLLCISSRGTNKYDGTLCLEGSLLRCLLNKCMPFSSFMKHALLWKLRQYYESNKINRILCPSMFLKSKLVENGFKNVLYLNNFVKYQENSVLKKHNYLLFCGRLIETKGAIYLVKAFELINQKHKGVKLIIIGDGYERDKLEKYVTRKKMNKRVTFLGNKSNKELTKYYKHATLTVVPSIGMENSPMAILESFSCGTPVVASKLGGIPELVKNNFTGMLFKPGDVHDLSLKIEYLLASPELLTQMSSNCINTVKFNYNEAGHYRKLMSIYESVLKKNI